MPKKPTTRRKATPQDVEIGNNLRILREARGVSMQDVAAALKITYQQVKKYETGENRIPASRLFEFAGFYGVEIESLAPEDYRAKGKDGMDQTKLVLALRQKLKKISDIIEE